MTTEECYYSLHTYTHEHIHIHVHTQIHVANAAKLLGGGRKSLGTKLM